MHISPETPGETAARLRRVIAAADFEKLPGFWWWNEFSQAEFPAGVRDEAIALVRDGDRWSQLVPLRRHDNPVETLRVWSFHFPPGIDNSGFIGWLATEIKRATGSGTLVVCGQNGERGGIYDYWAIPAAAGDDALRTIRALMVARDTA
ncbi:MAG TPA: DUF6196 family protein [Gemmatimonadaceae bacterium]|nr:DUF6196 family protein [Gemmatimonadaceae bacterium]